MGSPVSDAATELLVEGAKTRDGSISRISSLTGILVEANDREFSVRGDARSEAKWRSAVDELERAGLIEDRAGKGQLLFITDAGYAVADRTGEAPESV